MLYRINFMTTSQMTIEADSLDEAVGTMERQVWEMMKHSHHGEVTTANLQVQVAVGLPSFPELVWATLA